MKLSRSLSRFALLVITLLASLPPVFAATAHVPQTGQTTSYADGDDGDIQAGVDWPAPRFTNRGNGTVRDNLTGLTWLKNANCFGALQWPQALTAANLLAHGQCGLTDRSQPGDWRLPNINELHSLVAVAFVRPALSNAAGTAQWTEGNVFSGVQTNVYWASTTLAIRPDVAFFVHFEFGNIGQDSKEFSLTPYFVWPVSGRE